MKLFILGLAWVGGLFAGSYLTAPVQYLLLALTLTAALFLISLRYHISILYSMYLLALLLGMARFTAASSAENQDSVNRYQNTNSATMQGTIGPEILGKGRVIRFELSNIKIKSGEEFREVRGTILIETRRTFEYKYGDLLYIEGPLKPLSEAGEFYSYLERQGISSYMSFPRIKLLQTGSGPWLLQRVYDLRMKLSRSLSSFLPEPQGALSQALLLGLRQEVPAELDRDFRNTGTTHLLAISGMNISVFAGMVMSLGIWLFGRRHSLYLALAFLLVWLYTFLSGMNPPVIRAAFMASAYFLAEYLGRPQSAAPALALAAIIMTAIHPVVLWDVSFQLSFMAMLGLAFIAPPLVKLKENFPILAGGSSILRGFVKTTWDMASISVGAILATLPLTTYYFNIIPLAGLPATFFASLVLPYIIIISFITAVAGLFLSPFAQVLGWVDWIFLSYMILSVKAFSFLPYFTISLANFKLTALSYYGAAAAAAWYFSNLNTGGKRLPALLQKLKTAVTSLPAPGPKLRNLLLLCLLLANLLIWTAIFTLPDNFSHIHFLDVGHGDSVFIQTPGGHQILIDGGPEPYKARLYLGKKMPFWDRSLDIIAVTHSHQDHMEGLPQVLLKYKTDYILDAEIADKTTSYRRWQELVKERGAKSIRARKGLKIELGNSTSLEVLHPPQALESSSAADIDNNALVLLLRVGKVSFLFPSDNREKGQKETLLDNPDLWSTVLAAPHHGSPGAFEELFLKAASPSAMVMSAGAADKPALEKTITKLKAYIPAERLYSTSGRGVIEFITDGKKLWIRTER